MNNRDYERIVQEWREKPLSSAADIDVALDNFRVLFAYNSNRIENTDTTYHDTREIFDKGSVSGYTGELRTLFEIQNQKYCYDFLREKIVNREEITPVLICELHKILMSGCYDESRWEKGERPGKYKIYDYVTGDGVGSAPEDVADDMKSLCGEIANIPEEKALTAAAYLHLKFESIHPFADGNGRVGRTLMNYFLMTHGLPPTVLYEEDKKLYYMALAIYDKSEEISGFEEFIREQTIKTWSRAPKPVKTLSVFM
ncbi:MAG: Fic family protein [Mogibacterium sp.]|nr:Fic family protein [Mogibacterium sp.]